MKKKTPDLGFEGHIHRYILAIQNVLLVHI